MITAREALLTIREAQDQNNRTATFFEELGDVDGVQLVEALSSRLELLGVILGNVADVDPHDGGRVG